VVRTHGGWEAVDHAEARLRERATARQRVEDRRRRRRSSVAWILRIGLPLLGAAAVLATLQSRGGDLSGWTATTAAAVLGAAALVPAVLTGITARHDGVPTAILWALIALAAEVVLVFGAGFGLLRLGPH
jgi:hypothetical protein